MAQSKVITELKKIANLKMNTRKGYEYYDEVDCKKIEMPATIEINLNDTNLSAEEFDSLISTAQEHGHSVNFHNGSRFYHSYLRAKRGSDANRN